MSKHVIFVLHGVGDQTAGWSKPAIAEIKAQYKRFRLAGSFDARFQVKEVLYGQPFVDYWERHENTVAALKQLVVPSAAFANAVLSLANKVPEGKLRSHIGDAFLYASTLYNEPVTLDVNVQMEKELVRLGFPTYSVIAHSLGTRVIHDTLQRAFTSRSDKYVLRAKPCVLMMVSNVTRLSSFNSKELRRENGLRVFPSDSSTKGACQHYINVNHPLDPLASLRKYTPEFADDPNYYMPDIDSEDVSSANIHSLEHYCAHPAVAAAFFNQVIAPTPFDPDPISAATLKQALQTYRGDTLPGQLRQLHDEIQALEPTRFGRWETAVSKIADIFDIIKGFQP